METIETTETKVKTKYTYQNAGYNPEAYKIKVCIIGCGNEGSNLAVILARMGCDLVLIDGDTIEPHNIGSQFYFNDCNGGNKANELLGICELINDEVELVRIEEFITPDNIDLVPECDYYMLSTDTMKSRSELFKLLKEREFKLILDTRSGKEKFDLFAIHNNEADKEMYETTLYTDEEASNETCGIQNMHFWNTYKASVLAGLIMGRHMGKTIPKWTTGVFKDGFNPVLVEVL